MNEMRKELLNRIAIIYGENNDITKGFKALCETTKVPDAHLDMIAWYMNATKVEVMKKLEQNK